MKIVTKSAIYVEKYDLVFLRNKGCSIPLSILQKAFSNDVLTITHEKSKHEFIRFDDVDDIAFLKNFDLIVDYNKIRKMTKKQINDLIDGLLAQRNLAAEVYFSMSVEEQKNNRHIINEYALLSFKIHSIRETFNIAQGKISVQLPAGNYSSILVEQRKKK